MTRAWPRTAAVVALAGAAACLIGPGVASARPSATVCKVVTVTTRSHGRLARHRARICETAAIGLSHTTVTAVGGTVTVHYAATRATACSLAVTPAIWHGKNPTPVRCRAAYTFRVPAASAGRTWTFTFRARNRYGEITTAARRLIASPAPANPIVSQGYSSNWSGYAIEGGGITGATGTFTVPTVVPTPYETDTSEWVGVDGVSNGSLIQAGIHEYEYPGAKSAYAYPWWEILPAPETQIPNMPINLGDSITVNVHKVTASTWQIDLVDNTTRQAFSTRQTYTGPSTSAEWIVEAPTIGSSLGTLGQFSPVTFSGLGIDGVEMSLDQLFMVDSTNTVISSPSPLDPTGFAVAYGQTAPAAP